MLVLTSLLGVIFLSLGFQINKFEEHNIGYQPSNFQCFRLSLSSLTEWGGNTPPQCYSKTKDPSATRLLNDWGEQISYKSRYGCAASAESRLHKISPKNLTPRQQMPQNLMTSQVFMKFRVKISEFFNK